LILVPPYSPQSPKQLAADLSSDGHSDSDYEATRTEILNKRARRRSRGKVVSDTSESDEQAEEEMMKNVTDESQLRGRKSARKHKKRLTAKQKGKKKADSVVSGGEEVGDDDTSFSPII
jgi:hypothetical protein